jgi:hypothetical protein
MEAAEAGVYVTIVASEVPLDQGRQDLDSGAEAEATVDDSLLAAVGEPV